VILAIVIFSSILVDMATSQLVAHDDELRATAARLPYLVGFTV
jgi:hypothetical protein